MPTVGNSLIQMAKGLAYIHSNDIVHRNIKPSNVLISKNITLKISDCGLSKPTSHTGSFSTTSGAKGSQQIYMAPEYLALEGKSDQEGREIIANKSIDIFSLGCVFFTYLTRGQHLFMKPESYEYDTFSVTINILTDNKFLNNGEPIIATVSFCRQEFKSLILFRTTTRSFRLQDD